ncbi:transporter MCH1 [Acrasis kona]|uniref:Transporter MCH1 n=1 Tax=Acrasis kona TaxID=1008807 RepID=A0AAW2ZM01_9EUKA
MEQHPTDVIFRNRYLSLIAALFVMVSSGTKDVFPVYSNSMMKALDFDLYKIQTLGTALNVGTLIGLLPAFVYDFTNGRITLIISACANFFGYFMIYCALKNWITFTRHYIFIAFCGFIIGNASAGGFLACLGDNIKNFGQGTRGKIIGILVACFALSSIIYGLFFSYVFPDDQNKENLNHFILFTALSVTACYAIGVIFISQKQSSVKINNISLKINDGEGAELGDETPLVDKSDKQTFEEFDQNPLKMIQSLDFYIFSMLVASGIGSLTTVMNNIAQMVSAYPHDLRGKDPQLIHVIIFSVTNFLSRLLTGFITDATRRYISRPTWIVAICFLICFSQIFTALNYYYWMLYVSAVITGTLCGALWSICPAFISDKWGKKYFGINHEIALIGAAIVTYLMSTYTMSRVYGEHIDSEDGKTCTQGVHCYQLALLINASITFLTTCIGVLLIKRNKKLYEDLLTEDQ